MTQLVRRRGRPRSGEADARRTAILDAAFAELVASGYDATTMLAIARRAGASKETLYTWFGNKEGLFAALIRQQSERTNERVAAALAEDRPPRDVLIDFATNLLSLLLGPRSLAINRAAISAPDLAAALLRHGRHTTGPMVERYLSCLAADGEVAIDDPVEAFQLLYGLIITDWQIRALLGETPPAAAWIVAHATRAVDRFLALTVAPDQ